MRTLEILQPCLNEVIKMTTLARTVINEALSLPPLERAGLIEELLASFDRESRASVDRVWAIEAERRIDAYDAGETTAISLSESRARINNR
jgi:putative addiction module component (TIGR02574 family)